MTTDESLRKTQKVISGMVLAASGWNQDTFEHALTGPVVWGYVFDMPTKWTWLCSIDREGFAALSQESHADPGRAEAVRGGLAFLTARVADGSPPPPAEGLDWEQQLGAFLALYAGTTKTWELADRFESGGHFVVLNYRKPGDQGGSLRPFAMRPSASVLNAAELQQTIKNVIASDRSKHPEWFS